MPPTMQVFSKLWLFYPLIYTIHLCIMHYIHLNIPNITYILSFYIIQLVLLTIELTNSFERKKAVTKVLESIGRREECGPPNPPHPWYSGQRAKVWYRASLGAITFHNLLYCSIRPRLPVFFPIPTCSQSLYEWLPSVSSSWWDHVLGLRNLFLILQISPHQSG